MASVIFDNSTLSAVQRLMGTAPAPHWYDPQGDYSAFENFIAHLIFHEDFYYIDDYKPEFRQARAKDFTYCRPISISGFPYDVITDDVKTLTDDLIFDVRGGRLQPGLLKNFLENIGLYLTCAWHMQSSDYFLVLKILADGGDELRNKYSPLTSLIFNQISDRVSLPTSDRAILVGSDGNEISKASADGSHKIDHDLLAFVRSLNWLTSRTAFYTLVATYFEASTCLHPVRHNFLARWSTEKPVIQNARGWRGILISYFSSQADIAIRNINQATEPCLVGVNLPPFVSWAMRSAGNVTDAIKFVLDMRLKPEAIELRKHFRELDEIRREHEIAKFKLGVNRLVSAIEAESALLQRRYGRDPNGQGAPTISMTAQIAPLPGLSVSAVGKLPLGDIRSRLSRTRYIRSLFRNVVDDVVRFDQLGPIRSALINGVKRSKEMRNPQLRVENNKFFGKSSFWKKPM